MRIRNSMALAMAASLLTFFLSASPAAADVPPEILTGTNLDLSEMAAALALPVITGGQPPNTLKLSQGDLVVRNDASVTLATVTNGRSLPTLLRVDVISGDPTGPLGGDRWQSDSFDCLLTGYETTTFLVVPAAASSTIFVECSNAFATTGPLADNKFLGVRAANGVLWIAAADPFTGNTISEDVIFGDAVVVDVVLGQAYGFGAIPFQAGTGFNNGNKIYRFDGQEYASWPAVVATNFIAPDLPTPQRINAELILFTLDGTTGNPTAPRVALAGQGYNDDEVPFDFQWEFDCFDIVSITDMSVNFAQGFLGSLSGHLQLVPQPVGTGGNDVHDAAYGDGNNSRRRPVHGWIVQNVLPGQAIVLPRQPTTPGVVNPIVNTGASPAAWGRPLAQGRTSLVPFLNDQNAVLDAGPF